MSSSLLALFARSCYRLVTAVADFPVRLCCDLMVWTVAFLSLPIRLLTAFERERRLDRLLGEMQTQMDMLAWDNKELEERLQVALKDQKAIEALLDEMEEEHEDSLARVDLLEAQLHDLKEENMRLIECRGKYLSDKKAPGNGDRTVSDTLTTAALSPWSPGDGDSPSPWSRREASRNEAIDACTVSSTLVTASLTTDEALRHGRMVACRRSLFSLAMSVAVGGIMWKADAPCLPLVTGLFIVVGMSMCSVVRFYSTSRHKPASDAVALLSLNWFLLGVLTSPMLPSVAQVLVPLAAWLAGPVAARLGVPV